MSRLSFLLFGLLSIHCLCTGAETSDVYKRPLDLPAGGYKGAVEEDDVGMITFYAAEFEGDAFFWCLDKSADMADGDTFDILKQEVIRAVNALSLRDEFSLVAFSSNTSVWSYSPQEATPSNKARAVAWIQEVSAAGDKCLENAGVTTIAISNRSNKSNKQVFVVTDGAPVCNGVDTSLQCLANITAANSQGTPINAVTVCDEWCNGCGVLRTLAGMNNGTFLAVHDH